MKNSEHFYVCLAYIYYQNFLSYSVSITECLGPGNECTVQYAHNDIAQTAYLQPEDKPTKR